MERREECTCIQRYMAENKLKSKQKRKTNCIFIVRINVIYSSAEYKVDGKINDNLCMQTCKSYVIQNIFQVESDLPKLMNKKVFFCCCRSLLWDVAQNKLL